MMDSLLTKIFKQKKNVSIRFLVVCLSAVLVLQIAIPTQSSRLHAAEVVTTITAADGYLDKIIFGDTSSESVHNFKGDFTGAIIGKLSEPARMSNPRTPVEGQGGDLTFTMKVDPYLRNYFTMKFSGDDRSDYLTTVNINGEQIGVSRNGDYEAINKGGALPNRFYYSTVLLPLESTVGKETVEITVKTLNVWGKMEAASRGYYNAYTHTDASLNVGGETQGVKLKQDPASILAVDIADAAKQPKIDAYRQSQITKFNNLSAQMAASNTAKLSITRYQEDLKFYASTLLQSWSPAQTAAEKRVAVEAIFKAIDNHVKDYYANTKMVLRGGHQGDWGGYYGALGEALYIVENLIQDDAIYGEETFNDFLDQPFVTGTVDGEYSLAGVNWKGEQLTRRGAWERVLKANYDFARSRLSYIYNQVVYTYEGAWEAHEGLGAIGSDFYEGKERSHDILLEALGVAPFLGEEVLVGPNGEELDLYHSLFLHDATAVFTDDVVQIVGKGLAKSKLDPEGNIVRRLPYGKYYTGITEAGLTRENTYVANYGEASNYLVGHFFETLNHAGDEEMNNEILKLALKSINARGYARYTSLDDNGKRTMRAEQITDERNESYLGFTAYGSNAGTGMPMVLASLEMTMVQNEQKYSNPEWDKYWQYAKEAVGFVQQQMADHQFFNYNFGTDSSMSVPDYLLPDTYKYVTADRSQYIRFGGKTAAGVVLPQTDFDYYTPEEMASLGVNPADYQQFAWADIDNLFLSVRDDDVRIFGSLFFRNRGTVSNGRLHVLNGNYENVVQIATNNKFQYEDYYIRSGNVDVDFMSDQTTNVSGWPQALIGEMSPIAYQPGVGTVVRDNFDVDTPYSGYPDLLTAKYGKYLIIYNTTREEYGNKQSFEVDLPTSYTDSSILDLVSKTDIPIVNGKVTIANKSAMVLKLSTDSEAAPKPSHVDYVGALAGNGYVGISWKTTSGGETYTIKRSETEDGIYAEIATGITGNDYKDTTVQNGKVYYYKVAAVNENGAGWDSHHAKVDLLEPISGNTATAWRDDRIGTTTGSASINDAAIAIDDANGSGLGEGDDFNIYKRDINESLHYVNQAVAGNSSISAKIDSYSGEASGVMLRDQLQSNTRYIYFGADQDGNLVLQNRTRVSFQQWSGKVASPLNAGLKGYTASEYPYVKLVRDHDTQFVYAFVSKDGVNWQYVYKLMTLLPYAYFTGVVASDAAQFSEVTVKETPQNSIMPYTEKVKDQVTVSWNKPKQASWFNLYRTTDEAVCSIDPVFKPGTQELEAGSPWKLVLAGSRETVFKESGFRFGSVHYKVMAIHGDRSTQPISATATANSDSIATVLADAESLPSSDYTKVSYYLFHKELNRIKTELLHTEADEEALINEIYDSRKLLVSFRTILKKAQLQSTMVRASEGGWDGKSNEEQNGWFLFDGILNNLTHTKSAVSWVDVDFGTGNEKGIDTFRYLPRADFVSRANETIFKGSNDRVTWVDLHKITGVTEFKWHSGINTSTTPYRYIRIYDNHSGFVNFQEMEFLERGIDKTLLTYLLDKAVGAKEAGIYTAESLQALEQETSAATVTADNMNATQDEIDEASDSLRMAVEGLSYIVGMPVLESLKDRTIIAESILTFKLEAANALTDVVYGAIDLPEGASFDADTQTFIWSPRKEQGGVHTVTFTATAGELSSFKTIKITVKGQPVLATDTTVELKAAQAFTYAVPASDSTGETLVFSAENLPETAAFDASTGVFTWMPNQVDYGSHLVTFTVSNGLFIVSQTVDFKVILNIQAPENYSKGSYYRYLKEAELIEEELKKPGADKEKLLAKLAQAEGLLVHVPLSLYSFEENANNAFGTSNGIVSGLPSYKEGKFGQAIELNGTDGYVSLPSSHTLSGNEISVATWVYWKGGNQWQRIFDFGNNTNQNLFLTPRSGNDTLRFAIKNGGGEKTVQTTQLPSNQWVHVAVTLGNGTAKLYVNGEQTASADGFTIKPSDFKPSKNYIGKSQYPDPLYNGMIDDFSIYDYVLNAEEIKSLVNNTAKWIDSTLLTYLLEEAADVVIKDYTADSVEVFQTEVTNATSVSANTNATQEEIDAATASLKEAIEGLELLNRLPEFKAVAPINVLAGRTVTFSVYASDSDGDTVTYHPVSLPEGAAFDAATGQFNWTPSVIGVFAATFKAVDGRGGEAILEVAINVTAPNRINAALVGPAAAVIGGEVELSVGLTNLMTGFTMLDVVVHYDPLKFEFLTKTNEDGTLSLDENAITSSREGLQLLSTGVKLEQGLIRIIMGSAGTNHEVNSDGEILKLHAKVKPDALEGTANVSLSEFAVSNNGVQTEADTSQAAIDIQLAHVDKAALNAAIIDAQSLHDGAVEGIEAGQYPAGSKLTLQIAINEAKAVVEQTNATQEELNTALSELSTAAITFKASVNPDVTPVETDKAALIAAIEEAQNLHNGATEGVAAGQYPVGSKAALQTAINEAKAVTDNGGATQEQVNAAQAVLTLAIQTFKASINSGTPPVEADKTALTAAISTAQNLFDRTVEGTKIGHYATGAKTALQAAINAVKAVRDRTAATQAEVNEAILTLSSAVTVFSAKLITLVPGETKISINDLSIIAKYFGIQSANANWSKVSVADIFDENEITIRSLAAVAQLIIGDWFKE